MPSRLRVVRLLKDKLQSELHVPMLLVVVDAIDQSASGHLHGRIVVGDVIGAAGNEQIRMIEDVEELGSELQLLRFSQFHIAEETHVPRLKARSAIGISSQRPDEWTID